MRIVEAGNVAARARSGFPRSPRGPRGKKHGSASGWLRGEALRKASRTDAKPSEEDVEVRGTGFGNVWCVSNIYLRGSETLYVGDYQEQ